MENVIEKEIENAESELKIETKEDLTTVLIVHVLYLLSWAVPLTMLAGLIVCLVSRSGAGPISLTHYKYAISTFWISAAGQVALILGLIIIAATETAIGLILAGPGILMIIWAFVRTIIGLVKVGKKEEI